MRERRPKVGTIDICLARAFWEEKSMASWTKYVDRVVSRKIRKSNRKDGLSLAKYTRATSKGCRSIFLVHGMHASVGNNITVVELSSIF